MSSTAWTVLNRLSTTEQPLENRFRQFSLYGIVPAVAWMMLPLPLALRIVMILAMIVVSHLFVSWLWFRRLSAHREYETVFIDKAAAGAIAEVADELGEALGMGPWTFTTSSRGGAAAVAQLPDAEVDALISLTSSSSSRVFVDFVGLLPDSRLLITSYRRRPIVAYPSARWCYDVKKSPLECWEQHRSMLVREGVRCGGPALVDHLLLPLRRPNFFVNAGYLSFARTWPVSVWRSAGCVTSRR